MILKMLLLPLAVYIWCAYKILKIKILKSGKYKWSGGGEVGKYKWNWYLNEIVQLNWHLVNNVKQCYYKVYQSIIALRNFVKLTGKHLCQSLKKRDSGTDYTPWTIFLPMPTKQGN